MDMISGDKSECLQVSKYLIWTQKYNFRKDSWVFPLTPTESTPYPDLETGCMSEDSGWSQHLTMTVSVPGINI